MAGVGQPRISPTRSLGIHGWTEMDPLILAALVLEAPVLLVGEHGTGKTLLVERLAETLTTPFRSYDASLLDEQDLVGTPVPDAILGLRYVGIEAAVWDAGFVFVDGLERCSPELRSRVLALLLERRIGGHDLPSLVHRWASTSPPRDDHDGGSPLDSAIVDRFWLIVRVPGWTDLERQDRATIVAGGGRSDARVLAAALWRTQEALPGAESDVGGLATRYVVALTDALARDGISISPRRAAILRRTLVAGVAACRALERPEDPAGVFELVVRNGLPQSADATPPEERTILAAHRQVFRIEWEGPKGLRQTLVEEPDPVRRIAFALGHSADEVMLGRLVAAALAAQTTRAELEALATVLLLALRQHELVPGAWSQIVAGVRRILLLGGWTDSVEVGRELDLWCEARDWLATHEHTVLEQAVLNALGGAPLAEPGVSVLMERLRAWTELFGVRLPAAEGPSMRVLDELAPAGPPGPATRPTRVKVLREVPLVEDGWVLFDLVERIDDEDPPDPRRRLGALTPAELAGLDARWRELGLTGGARVFPERVVPLAVPIVCLDLDLILNVLLRLRGDLFLFAGPLHNDRGPATSAAIVADPRLHAHVIASGRYRPGRRRR